MAFIERYQLYTDDQAVAAKEVLERIDRDRLHSVRVVFADQHGLLRGKTVAAGAMASVLRDGLTVVSTLLSKDTSGATVLTRSGHDSAPYGVDGSYRGGAGGV